MRKERRLGNAVKGELKSMVDNSQLSVLFQNLEIGRIVFPHKMVHKMAWFARITK